ncbi:amino acid/polyamine/organocation transporter, APC superfamily (TC 2.A.3) [Natronorubrum sediminis]|uniref:Amino acid/polyamine/organocation transporter, APC superfamily (TC 2.A.3) n=1 Tax=Natronorubrum sediminis TaxID=640943 RepID=A0A1H6G009_9EURY|nr:amino acid/polyamine/organocation transporter, APC superfamily (TC 2.A.3) [Natronorubrum sediminis]
MGADDFKLINEKVGPGIAIALLIGTALGMSIFLVPTQMAAEAGPSIILAILLAIIPMALGVLQLLQLGGAIPVAGGAYVYGSRLVGPFWGFLNIMLPVVAVWAYLLFAALGFAQYLPYFLELIGYGIDVNTTLAVWAILGFFLAVNYVGIRVAAKAQIALVAVLIAGMLTFIVGGLASFDPANFDPLFPDGEGQPFEDGLAPFFLAIVLLYIPYQGFAMIIEIGEELEDPVKNIPRVLAVGMSFVAVLSVVLVVALIGGGSWEAAVGADGDPVEGALAAVGEEFGTLPTAGVVLIAVAALVAAATTVNTLYTSYSRTVMRASRDNLLPGFFAGIHDRFDTPHRAVIFMGVPPLAVAPFIGYLDEFTGPEFIDWLVVIVVTGTFLSFMISGLALWNLPKKYPQRYEYSVYKLPLPVLKLVAVGNIVMSFVFMVLVAASAPTALIVVVVFAILSAIGYVYQVRTLERNGTNLREEMSSLHHHEGGPLQTSESDDD